MPRIFCKVSYDHNIVTSKVDLWEKYSLFVIYRVTGPASCQEIYRNTCNPDVRDFGYTCPSQQNSAQGAIWEFGASCCMHKIMQCNTETLPAPEGRAGMVLASHSDEELWPLSMANWPKFSTSTACLCCLQFWSYLYISCFGFFCILAQGTDTASNLDRSTYMQNCDPREAICFNFCVAQFSPQVFFSKPSASRHKCTSHHAAQH